jgi:predicted PurR-regulated permease PerM
MTAKHHIYFWISAFLVFLAITWALKGILLPFILGAAIAYLLEPIMEFLYKKGLPRTLSALLILIFFFVVVAATIALLAPIFYRQSLELINAIPGYIDTLWEMGTPYILWLQEKVGNGDFNDFQSTIQKNIGNAVQVGNSIISHIANGGHFIAGTLSLIVITPLVSFFMMKEWLNMTSWFDKHIPRHNYQEIKGLLQQIDQKISGFVRGQFMIALSLGIIYATLLFIFKLEYGILIGLSAGLLSIIPLIGSTVGLLISVLVAWFQNGELSFVLIIAAIFMVGQFVEGNILTPKLLGKSVGLHPLWILFAIMAGGSLYGLVGMFLAVPVAASIGVLIGFGLQKYKNSPYYEKKKPAKKRSKKKKVRE